MDPVDAVEPDRTRAFGEQLLGLLTGATLTPRPQNRMYVYLQAQP